MPDMPDIELVGCETGCEVLNKLVSHVKGLERHRMGNFVRCNAQVGSRSCEASLVVLGGVLFVRAASECARGCLMDIMRHEKGAIR